MGLQRDRAAESDFGLFAQLALHRAQTALFQRQIGSGPVAARTQRVAGIERHRHIHAQPVAAIPVLARIVIDIGQDADGLDHGQTIAPLPVQPRLEAADRTGTGADLRIVGQRRRDESIQRIQPTHGPVQVGRSRIAGTQVLNRTAGIFAQPGCRPVGNKAQLHGVGIGPGQLGLDLGPVGPGRATGSQQFRHGLTLAVKIGTALGDHVDLGKRFQPRQIGIGQRIGRIDLLGAHLISALIDGLRGSGLGQACIAKVEQALGHLHTQLVFQPVAGQPAIATGGTAKGRHLRMAQGTGLAPIGLGLIQPGLGGIDFRRPRRGQFQRLAQPQTQTGIAVRMGLRRPGEAGQDKKSD